MAKVKPATYEGRACAKGHTERYVKSRRCVVCRTAYQTSPERREYNRRSARVYRAANPEYAARQRAASKAYTARRRLDPALRAKWNAESSERQYRKKYGITLAQKHEMLAAQGGRCAICLIDNPTTFRPWHVDHDHATGKVRGILCHHCNMAAGAVKDNPTTAMRLVAYLLLK